MKASFSIIMPSYLGDYPTAATNREEKLERAIKSVINQSYKKWELIIVSDGCNKTVEVAKKFTGDKRVRLFKIKKQKMWGGRVRNTGISKAVNDWIIYLDSDDSYNKDYLKNLNNEIDNTFDWFWLDEYSWDRGGKVFNVRTANVKRKGQCGTSNILHKKSLGLYWYVETRYALDDFMFINLLKLTSKKYKKLKTVGYEVCHVPNLLDH